jgi:hypothetical protein
VRWILKQDGTLVNWLRDEERTHGPHWPKGFEIGARMSPVLNEAIENLTGLA